MSQLVDIFDIPFQTERKETKEDRQQRLRDSKDIQKLAEKFISNKTERNFNALVKRCNWGLRSFIHDMTGNDYDTDNIISMTLEHVWFGIDTFKPEIGKFSTWMYTIAYNDTLRYFNNNGMREKLNIVPVDISEIYGDVGDDEDERSFDCGPYDTIPDDMYFDGKNLIPVTRERISSEIYDASVECIGYLPDNLRIVMWERYVEKKTVAQIAKDNNISVFSVQNWLFKGKKCLFDEVKCRYPKLYDIYVETLTC